MSDGRDGSAQSRAGVGPGETHSGTMVWADVRTVMGIPMSIHVRSAGEATGSAPDEGEKLRRAASGAAERAFAILADFDETFSLWKPDSELSRFRRGELGDGELSPSMLQAILLGDEAREATDGLFETGTTTSFDPTGFVKGWAAELASAELVKLERLGLEWLLNAGGDVVCGGDCAWTIGIEDATDPSRLVGTVALTRGALATSGTYARGAHLVDPRSGRSSAHSGSVSVVGPSLTWADIWATAIFVGDATTAQLLAEWDPAYGVVVDQRTTNTP